MNWMDIVLPITIEISEGKLGPFAQSMSNSLQDMYI